MPYLSSFVQSLLPRRLTNLFLNVYTVISIYYPLVDTNRYSGTFTFDVDAYLEALLGQYDDGNMVIEPRAFYHRLEELRLIRESHKTIYW
jgi:hypothetical protein